MSFYVLRYSIFSTISKHFTPEVISSFRVTRGLVTKPCPAIPLDGTLLCNSRFPTRLSVRYQTSGTEELPPRKNQPIKAKSPITWKSVGITFGIGGAIILAMLHFKKLKQERMEKERKRVIGKAKIGGNFNLVDHNGKPCSSKDFFGKWVLIYFGFTNCPDICPDEIEKMITTVDILEKRNVTKVQPLFITVDQERDNIKAVESYVKEFSPKLIGLTGSKEQIDEATRLFRVYYSAGPRDSDNDYIVDHTIIMYLINPDGEFVDYYGQNKTAEEVADGITLSKMKYESKSWF